MIGTQHGCCFITRGDAFGQRHVKTCTLGDFAFVLAGVPKRRHCTISGTTHFTAERLQLAWWLTRSSTWSAGM